MMNGMNQGWSMGYGLCLIIGLIVFAVVVWLLIKVVNQNNNSKTDK